MTDGLILETALTRSDGVRLFLHGYYSRPGWQWVRILATPLLAGLGLVLLTLGHRFTSIYGGICIGYAAYYGLRPIFLLIPRLKQMVDLKSTYEIVPGEGLRFTSGSASTLIEFVSVRGVHLKSRYLTIEVKTKRKYFFHVPRACIVRGDAEAFADRLIKEIGKEG